MRTSGGDAIAALMNNLCLRVSGFSAADRLHAIAKRATFCSRGIAKAGATAHDHGRRCADGEDDMTRARCWRSGMGSIAAQLVIFTLSIGQFCEPASGQDRGQVDRQLQRFAVNVSGGLFGVYLGNGLVITAAHVVNPANPTVRIAGESLQAKIVKAGTFEKTDITLLSVDVRRLPPNLGLRIMPICSQPLLVGQNVVVATPQSIARSRIMSPDSLPADVRERFNTVIPDVATTGNSGSGVFDPTNQCLMGIMSRKIQISAAPTQRGPTKAFRDIAKYFVPAAEIRAFLHTETR